MATDQGIFNRASGCCIKGSLLWECQTHTHANTHKMRFFLGKKKKTLICLFNLAMALVTNHTPSLRANLFTHTQRKSSLHSAVMTDRTGFSPPLSAYCGRTADTRRCQVLLREVKAPHRSGAKTGEVKTTAADDSSLPYVSLHLSLFCSSQCSMD